MKSNFKKRVTAAALVVGLAFGVSLATAPSASAANGVRVVQKANGV